MFLYLCGVALCLIAFSFVVHGFPSLITHNHYNIDDNDDDDKTTD